MTLQVKLPSMVGVAFNVNYPNLPLVIKSRLFRYNNNNWSKAQKPNQNTKFPVSFESIHNRFIIVTPTIDCLSGCHFILCLCILLPTWLSSAFFYVHVSPIWYGSYSLFHFKIYLSIKYCALLWIIYLIKNRDTSWTARNIGMRPLQNRRLHSVWKLL